VISSMTKSPLPVGSISKATAARSSSSLSEAAFTYKAGAAGRPLSDQGGFANDRWFSMRRHRCPQTGSVDGYDLVGTSKHDCRRETNSARSKAHHDTGTLRWWVIDRHLGAIRAKGSASEIDKKRASPYSNKTEMLFVV
jgi:hypothetical protein